MSQYPDEIVKPYDQYHDLQDSFSPRKLCFITFYSFWSCFRVGWGREEYGISVEVFPKQFFLKKMRPSTASQYWSKSAIAKEPANESSFCEDGKW